MKIILAVSVAILVLATPSFAAAKKNTTQVHAATINTQISIRHTRLRLRTQQVVVLTVGY